MLETGIVRDDTLGQLAQCYRCSNVPFFKHLHERCSGCQQAVFARIPDPEFAVRRALQFLVDTKLKLYLISLASLTKKIRNSLSHRVGQVLT